MLFTSVRWGLKKTEPILLRNKNKLSTDVGGAQKGM